MTTTRTEEATGAAKPVMSTGQLVALKPPRLPYHEAVEERFGIDRAGWKALVEAIYPNAETADAIVMALSYCRARNLDPSNAEKHLNDLLSRHVRCSESGREIHPEHQPDRRRVAGKASLKVAGTWRRSEIVEAAIRVCIQAAFRTSMREWRIW